MTNVRMLHPDARKDGYQELIEEPENEGAHSRPRILLALSSSGNRSLISEQLRAFYTVIEPGSDQVAAPDFDLAIIDTANFKRWHTVIQDAKVREEPTFLPVILVLSRHELKKNIRVYWDYIDEFVVTPMDKLEFSERISMLLRARHLAKTQRAQLAYLATHDRITGLPNNQRFKERVSEVVLDASILNQTVQVMVVQISVNRIMNSLGHRGLDQAAAICTSRLRALASDNHYCARLTTETWGILQPVGQSKEELFEFCQRLAMIADDPLDIDNERVHIGITMGVGLYPDDASDSIRVLDCAINALGTATNSQPQFYCQSVQHHALRFIRTETLLRKALEAEQFELWYQPQIRLSDNQVVGVEALVRWRLPNGSLAPPQDFLTVAQTTGLIVPLDRWVLKRACKDMKHWQQLQININRVAVNITAEDVQQEDFVSFVTDQLSYYELSPSMLELELTESTILKAGQSNINKLNELRVHGLEIAIDDFGTGYSSLAYLHTLPISILKIDQCFVRNILEVEADVAITKTILWLAKNFKLNTVAEGIETRDVADFLKDLGVDTAQGYFYSKPMPEPEFRKWLGDWNSEHCQKDFSAST